MGGVGRVSATGGIEISPELMPLKLIKILLVQDTDNVGDMLRDLTRQMTRKKKSSRVRNCLGFLKKVYRALEGTRDRAALQGLRQAAKSACSRLFRDKMHEGWEAVKPKVIQRRDQAYEMLLEIIRMIPK